MDYNCRNDPYHEAYDDPDSDILRLKPCGCAYWPLELCSICGLEALPCLKCGHVIYQNAYDDLPMPEICEKCGGIPYEYDDEECIYQHLNEYGESIEGRGWFVCTELE